MSLLSRSSGLRIVLAVALLAGCGIVALLLAFTTAPLESPKTLIAGIPLYSGSYGTVWSDSSQPGFAGGNPGWPGYDEAARVSFQISAGANAARDYYGSWFANNGWVPWGNMGGWYETGPETFAGFHLIPDGPLSGLPWFSARRVRRSEYRANVEAKSAATGITDVTITIYRLGVSASARQTALAAPVPTAMPTLSGTILPSAVQTVAPVRP